MPDFTVQERSAASPSALFQLATDFARLPEAIPEIDSIEVLSPGPTAVGTRFRETRTIFGKSAVETFTVTAFAPPGDREDGDGVGGFTLETESCGMRYVATHRVRPDAAGSIIELNLKGELVTSSWLTRIAAPLTDRLFGPMMRKAVRRDLVRLAAAAEQAADQV